MMKRIEVKVVPKSSREEIVEDAGGMKVYVKAAPEKGKANAAVISLIAKRFRVRKSGVRIIAGGTGRKKIVEVNER